MSSHSLVGLFQPPRRRESLALTATFIVAAIAALLAFSQFARTTFRVGPARVTASVAVGVKPGTTIVVPPFGAVSAPTHKVPLEVSLTLDEVDLEGLDRLAAAGLPDDEAVAGYLSSFERGVMLSGVWGLLAAALAGAGAAMLLARRWRVALTAGVVGAALPALLLVAAGSGFDVGAFQNPTFHGNLTHAPGLIRLVGERAATVESLREQILDAAESLAGYYARPQSFAAGGSLAGTVRVLHVSDIHLDPVGIELTKRLADEFGVSFVVNTGDIDFLGSGVEAAYVSSQLPTDVPTVFVPGNHDSPAVIDALSALPNVDVLEATSTQIDGMTVFGLADPASYSSATDPQHAASRRVAEEEARKLRLSLGSGVATPTLVAVHDPAMRNAFAGLVQLVVNGHTHTPSLTRSKGTWLLDSGTTGGIDLNAMKADRNVPHSASILYFTASPPRRLVAIDQIEVSGFDGSTTLRRTVTAPDLLPLDSAETTATAGETAGPKPAGGPTP